MNFDHVTQVVAIGAPIALIYVATLGRKAWGVALVYSVILSFCSTLEDVWYATFLFAAAAIVRSVSSD